MATLADALRQHGPAYLAEHLLSTPQAKAWRGIVACRTAALGGQQLACDACGHSHWQYHSCRNRHCPQCGAISSATRRTPSPSCWPGGPNQVWSWDITKLKGPAKWTCFHLYVILDIFSRCVVGWLIALRESAELAEQLIAETVARHEVLPGTLTLHADRGASMRSKPVAALLVDLDIAKSHSRPHVSDDNPYSESQFKTMKYRPDFPARFGCIEDARAHCQAFFAWYNSVHRHSGIGYMTPHAVHQGHAEALLITRQATLDAAFLAHPNRFKNTKPQPHALPTAAWINPPPPQEKHPAHNPQPCTVNS